MSVAASVDVVVVVEERSNVTTCNVGIVLIFTRKITCGSSFVVSCLAVL